MATKISPEEFVEAFQEWTVLDVKNALQLLEDKLGIKPAVAAAAAVGAPTGAAEAAPEVEQTEFTVVLTGAGDAKINTIKAVREITGLGLKEAKDLVDGAPKPVKEGVTKEEAEAVGNKLKDAGAVFEIR